MFIYSQISANSKLSNINYKKYDGINSNAFNVSINSPNIYIQKYIQYTGSHIFLFFIIHLDSSATSLLLLGEKKSPNN